MSKKIQTNQKHMNQDNRVIIEKRLDASTPLSHIAEELALLDETISPLIRQGQSAYMILQNHPDDILLMPKLLKGKIEA